MRSKVASIGDIAFLEQKSFLFDIFSYPYLFRKNAHFDI
jgi:hypothetical protein